MLVTNKGDASQAPFQLCTSNGRSGRRSARFVRDPERDGRVWDMRIKIDLEACVGHGKCYMVEPELFEPMDEDDIGRARATVGSIDAADAELLERIERAIASCPEGAIELVAAGDAADQEG